jgi:hypothetical protein
MPFAVTIVKNRTKALNHSQKLELEQKHAIMMQANQINQVS